MYSSGEGVKRLKMKEKNYENPIKDIEDITLLSNKESSV